MGDMIDKDAVLTILNDHVQVGSMIEAITALPAATVDDGRPFSTDVFLVALFNEFEDPEFIYDAINEWMHGDWENATWGLARHIPALQTKGDA